ncbi:hypothetical protein PIB30_068094 [Stylosanthes scabra]|uniref:RRM domain-containing protein n=1 Tax=Stylosanthes scabra TaxID=79078 RepID=A0ABU6TMI6_9FABA|nr:hypothetical protein [Stylosanthes scabra]
MSLINNRGFGSRNGREELTTVFVDNLYDRVTKRELYKKFGRDGYIADIFVSRKLRGNARSPFAFIRFQRFGGALRSIRRLNRTVWKGRKLYMQISRVRRHEEPCLGQDGESRQRRAKPKITKKWVEVQRANEKDTRNHGEAIVNRGKEQKRRQKVDVVWASEQNELLTRSLLGVCIKPIEFRKAMNLILDEWNGPGELDCRDMGPYRCLITFSSMEIKDGAMGNELLNSVFDEVRPHWEFCGSLSRRVWIEIMGLPVGLWCTENLSRITKLWGKIIKQDDRTEETKSFSTARVLLDSFQWETIHEWVTLKIDGWVFDVFVKEFGSQVYSVQSHSDLVEEVSGSLQDDGGGPGSAEKEALACSGVAPAIFEKED